MGGAVRKICEDRGEKNRDQNILHEKNDSNLKIEVEQQRTILLSPCIQAYLNTHAHLYAQTRVHTQELSLR